MTTTSRLAIGGTVLAAAAAVAAAVYLRQPSAAGSPRVIYRLPFTKIAKWKVRYDDAALGRVEGVAFCEWAKPYCHVLLDDPYTHDARSLESSSIRLPGRDSSTIAMTLRGPSPTFVRTMPPEPADRQIAGGDEETVTISIKNGDIEQTVQKPVTPPAAAAQDTVSLALDVGADTTLSGRWHYDSDPLTERGADGLGRIGAFHLGDGDQFLGTQTGHEWWTPLLPRIYATYVVEDQAAFNDEGPLYPHAGGDAARPTDQRTLVVIGQDLPVDGGRGVQDITNPDELRYTVLTSSRGKTMTDREKAEIEQAFVELTKDMDAAETAAFRRLDAALVQVRLAQQTDAGPKVFRWGAARSEWFLQYGDNTADIRFARVFNDKESETAVDLAVPETVVVEVQPKNFSGDQIAVQVGGPAVSNAPLDLVATRVASRQWLFRTPPITLYFDGKKAPATGGLTLAAAKGKHLLATVNREKTHFLRVGEAEATAGEASLLWMNAMYRASACPAPAFNQRTGPTSSNWTTYAGYVAEQITYKGQAVDIHFGDHAAMIILHDAFLKLLASQIQEITTAMTDNGLVDAWYRNMHDLVTQTPGFPLADVAVPSPGGGTVPFRQAYSERFRQDDFHPDTVGDGQSRYVQWRRRATLTAMTAFRSEMERTQQSAAIPDCDRRRLLTLTGAGFTHVADHIAPLLMKLQPNGELMEPDRVARAYVKNLDVVAERLRAVEEFSGLVDRDIVIAASALAAPAAGLVWGSSATGALGLVAGFAQFGYESAYDIYDTYKQHEEVRFAYGTTTTLGPQRYFDAESRATPWWLTGVKIFGNALVQGYWNRKELYGLATEGMALWRGTRALAKPSVTLGAVRALPAEVERDAAVALLKEQEQIAEVGVVGERNAYPNRVFKEMGQAAKAEPPPTAIDPIPRDLEVDAMIQSDPGVPDGPFAGVNQWAPIEPAKHLEADAAEVALANEAKTANIRDLENAGKDLDRTELSESVEAEFRSDVDRRMAAFDAEAAQNPALAAEREAVEQALAAEKKEFTPDLPLPKRTWKLTVNGKPVTMQLGKIRGQGSFFTVYELEGVPNGITLNKGLQGKRLVVKVLNKTSLVTFDHRVFGGTADTLNRMNKAQALLEAAGILQSEFQDIGTGDVILQEFLDTSSGAVKIFDSTKEGMRQEFKADPGFGRAVIDLYKKLSDKGLVWIDGHVNNIFFKRVGGKWVAGVLDQDFLTTFGQVRDGTIGRYFYRGFMPAGRFYPHSLDALMDVGWDTPERFMQKMFEVKGWLAYDPAYELYEPSLLDPQDVKSVFTHMQHVEQYPTVVAEPDPAKRLTW